jgi:short-subunit dehydrogenase
MRPHLKPLQLQIIVITGASSGIGLATARAAARRGARVVVAARSEEELRQLVQEIESAGGQALAVAADVGNEADVRKIADAAIARFGGFDTWVNNAGVSVYGRIDEVSMQDHRRLFETNFWGVVHGSRVAVEHLRNSGGVLINIGSVVSDQPIPLQGMYSASKHAVKGFTDALRMELEKEGAPISVCLIKPAGIDTPYPQHAKNYMDVEPTLPPPVYSPDVVADAILHCAEHPHRDLIVGGGGKVMSSMSNIPRLADKYMEATMFKQQRSDRPARGRLNNSLYTASRDLSERGRYEGHVMESSLYTQASLHPVVTSAAVVAGVGLLVAAVAKGTSAHGKRWS